MNLLDMSFAGGVLILAVIVLRAMALNRLPKGTFLALWAVAAARLLVPFSIPSPASIYTLAESVPVQNAVREAVTVGNPAPAAPVFSNTAPATPAAVSVPESGAPADVRFWVWMAGAVICGVFFLISYLRCRREFRTALPVENEDLLNWLAGQKLRRTVALRRLDRVDAPLTYGLLRPVILLPKAGTEVSRYALEHEMVHIRRLDALWKPLLVLTACVHWFNPLVWCMFVLANRDMELRCDEAVVRRLGLDRRSDYALALISMEEGRSGLGPFASAFSKNAIEERIRAIMKIKKRSIAAILAAVVLVCCLGVGFATSAAKDKTPYPLVEDGSFTKKELDRLASLWFEGYRDMTVTEYQQKMWSERDNRSDMALIERYGQYSAAHPEDAGPVGQHDQSGVDGTDFNSLAEVPPSRAFYNYFHQVFEPLTAHNWQERTFSDAAAARTADGGTAILEYDFTMHILDPDVLTVGDYEKRIWYTRASAERMLQADMSAEQFPSVYQVLSTTTPDGALEITTTCAPLNVSQSVDEIADYLRQSGDTKVTQGDGYIFFEDPDAALHAQSSRESAKEWDELLSPYAAFGLTWEFNDPDLDGNGLTMWFEGKEVRGIMDEQEGVWITEHAGNSTYSDGAVELYTVYTDGKLSGLRLATPEEQAGWDAERNGVRAIIPLGIATLQIPEEQREFPQATDEDYASLLNLCTPDAYRLSLEKFNERLLNWANANSDAWDRINCDVIWNDYGVQLSQEEKTFVSLTCSLSGTENGQMIRALHTGGPEQDPGFSANLPEKFREEDGIRTAWCSLYYDISYHVSDKSAVTVRERDALAGGMMDAINAFWQNTDLDALLTMTEEDVVSWLNAWAEEAGTENLRFNPITADSIHFEAYDDRGVG